VDGDAGDIQDQTLRLKIDKRERELAMLEKQYVKLCEEAEERSGQAKATPEAISASYIGYTELF
jgi:hypothetical protein